MIAKYICSLLLLFSISGIAQTSDCGKKTNSSFKKHFRILDSVAKISVDDTISNCYNSVRFMEDNTGIEASTDADYFGRQACTKEDLAKWRKWYEKSCLNKPKKKKSNKNAAQ